MGNSPAEGGNSPAEGGNSPAEGGSSSAEGGISPAEGVNSPAEWGNSPAEGGNSPAERGNSPVGAVTSACPRDCTARRSSQWCKRDCSRAARSAARRQPWGWPTSSYCRTSMLGRGVQCGGGHWDSRLLRTVAPGVNRKIVSTYRVKKSAH
eukprot:1184259-Prorocentrum_minimum.AAC.1